MFLFVSEAKLDKNRMPFGGLMSVFSNKNICIIFRIYILCLIMKFIKLKIIYKAIFGL